jgi:DNA topoisomerase-3
MIKALLIAEKPSLAQAIKEGYANYPNKKYDITYLACAGHLMETLKPDEYCAEWKKWELDVLPMIPKRFQSKVSKNGFTRYKAIKDALKTNSYDLVINAGDPAREGELIVDEILKSLNCKLPELRLWTEDLTVNGICKAFDNLLQPQNNLKKAAYLRQWNDWLMGMNCSRAASLSTGCSISVGRVMSVITAMVVNRDKEIKNFVPEPYYECTLTIKTEDGSEFTGKLLREHNDYKFNSQEEIQELMNTATAEGKVIKIENTTKKTEPPLLLNLTELQKEAFSVYGYSPDVVLKAAQSLYENKLLSYPRTDCRYISENVASELDNNLRALAEIPEYSSEISRIINDVETLSKICKHKNKYVDNSKLTDHHALITTAKKAQFTDLTDIEANIYKLVARRVVALFMPNKLSAKTKVICSFGDITTLSEGQSVIQEGYSKVIPDNTSEKFLPKLNDDDPVDIVGVEGNILYTKPKSHYNFKTLLEDMENCGKFAMNKDNAKMLKNASGIGQSSTRDSIIKKVISLNYIAEVGKGKKSHLEATPEGNYIAEVLSGTELVNVDTTAVMEGKLAAVERGEYDANTYYLEMIDDIKRLTEQLKGLPKASDDNPLKKNNKYAKKSQSVNTDLLCPICGKQIMESDKGFYCSGWKEKSCKYYLGKEVFGVKLSLQDFKTLLAGGQINRRFTWKSGKKSNALLSIKDNKYKFDFI